MGSARLRIWGIPLVLALLGFAGLVLALIGDGAWDIASWLCLGLIVALSIKGLSSAWFRS